MLMENQTPLACCHFLKTRNRQKRDSEVSEEDISKERRKGRELRTLWEEGKDRKRQQGDISTGEWKAFSLIPYMVFSLQPFHKHNTKTSCSHYFLTALVIFLVLQPYRQWSSRWWDYITKRILAATFWRNMDTKNLLKILNIWTYFGMAGCT